MLAHAQTLTWTGAGDGTTFSAPANWSPAATPGPTSDCVVPAGGATTLTFGNTSTIRSLTIARNATIKSSCSYASVTAGLVLQNGITLTFDEPFGCVGLGFAGGPQSISGSGTLLLKNSGPGSPGSILYMHSNADVTIESDIIIRTGPETIGTKLVIGIATGSRLTNRGLITASQAGSFLSILGTGTFDNLGTARANNSGRLEIFPSKWSNSGTFEISTGILMLGGEYSSWGTLVRNAGVFILSGKYLSPTVAATAATGDITLNNIELSNATLSAEGGVKLLATGSSTLRSCVVTTDISLSCATWIISGGLTLNSKLTVASSCSSSILRFQGSAQTLTGNGLIDVPNGAFLGIDVAAGGNATLAPNIPIQLGASASKGSSIAISLGTGATLRNQTPLIATGPSPSIAVTGSGTFINESQITAPSNSTLTITPGTWLNPGSVSATNSNVTLGGIGNTISNFTRTGGSLTLTGAFSGTLLTNTPSLGSFVLKDFSATAAVLLPVTPSTITIAENVKLTACTIAGQVGITGCGSLTVQGGIVLAEGAKLVAARNPNTCTGDAIVFDGGEQAIGGTGSIVFQSYDPKVMRLVNGAIVTLGSGVSLETLTGAGSTFNILLDAGCKFINQGVIRSTILAHTISFQGAGEFQNTGTLELSSGILQLFCTTWNSTGQVNLSGNANLQVQGSPSWMTSINQTGGTFSVSGTASGSVLEVGDQQGDVWIENMTLTGVTLRTTGSARFLFRGPSTLNSCIIDGVVSLQNSADVRVRGGLELLPASTLGMTLPPGSTAYRPLLSFETGSQEVKGAGSINVEWGTISVATDTQLRIGPNIVVQTTTSNNTGGSFFLSLNGSAQLINEGTIRCTTGKSYIDGSCNAASTFDNRGVIEVNADYFRLQSPKWINSGKVVLSDTARILLTATFDSLGTFERTGGTVQVSGTCTGTVLDVPPLGGDILFSNITFNGCTFTGSAAGKPVFGDETTLNACTFVGIASFGTCSDIIASGGLTLAGSTLSFSGAGNCSNRTNLRMVGAPQAFSGEGTVVFDDCTVAIETSTTIGPDIKFVAGPMIENGPSNYITVASGAILTNLGDISMSRPSRSFSIGSSAGAFINLGSIRAIAGTTNIYGLSGSLGDVAVSPGAILSVSGNYSIDSALSVAAGSTLTLQGTWTNNGAIDVSGILNLAGTWTNNSSINVTNAALNITGTWTNAGTITLLNSTASIGGTPANYGNIQSTGTKLTYTGTYTGSLLEANATTGDITLNNLSLSGATLRAVDGARFLLAGSALYLNNCSLDTTLTLTQCYQIRVTNVLTFVNGASIIVNNSCNTPPLSFSGAFNQQLAGDGQIVLRNSAASSFFEILPSITVTIGSGVTVVIPSDATLSNARIQFGTTGKLINRGRFVMNKVGGSLTIDGPFENQGSINASSGSLILTALTGPIGDIEILPGSSLSLDGNYTIDHSLSIAGGVLALAGTWTNLADISVANGHFTLGGTWTNSGNFNVQSSNWTIGGTYTSLGNHTASGNSLAYAGTFPGTSLVADSSTGDILLLNLSLKNTRIETRDGAQFILGSGATLSLDACSIASNLTFTSCSALAITNGLTLEDNATIQLRNKACPKASMTFTGAAQTIGGNGRILISDPASVADLQFTGSAQVTIASGVSIQFRPTTAQPGSISISTGRTLVNRGLISSNVPGGTFSFTGAGTFSNEGVVESTLGTLAINPTTISNFTPATGTLSGGTWRAIGGSWTLGTRVISNIGPATDIRLKGPSITTPNFSALTSNAGTLALASLSITSTPQGGTFTNSGTLELGSGALWSFTGNAVLSDSSVLRLPISDLSPAKFGRLATAVSATLGGRLTGSFVAPYIPVEGDLIPGVLSSPSITGSFAGVCIEPNAALLGAQPIIDSATSPMSLNLLVSPAGGTSPAILTQPSDVRAAPNAVLSVTAGPADVAYQWFKETTEVVDGPTGNGSSIAGSKSSVLTIFNTSSQDAGLYKCTISNFCGSTTSRSANVSVCEGDFNADSLVDDADFSIFITAYNTLDCTDPAMPAGCPADLNHDQVVDDADFSRFVVAYDALLCP